MEKWKQYIDTHIKEGFMDEGVVVYIVEDYMEYLGLYHEFLERGGKIDWKNYYVSDKFQYYTPEPYLQAVEFRSPDYYGKLKEKSISHHRFPQEKTEENGNIL